MKLIGIILTWFLLLNNAIASFPCCLDNFQNTGKCAEISSPSKTACEDTSGGLFGYTCCTQGKFMDKCKVNCNGNFISLISFHVTPFKDTIQASWITGYEANNDGMNVWCSQMEKKEFKKPIKLNTNVVPTMAIPPFGTNYSVNGNEKLETGVHYCVLEDIDRFSCTLHCDQISAVSIGNTQEEINLDAAMEFCNSYANVSNGVCLDDLFR